MNLGHLFNKAVHGYTKGVDDLLSKAGVPQAIGLMASATGIPGMDKVLIGVEKLLPEGGLRLGDLRRPTTSTPRKQPTKSTPVKPVYPNGAIKGVDLSSRELTQSQKTTIINKMNEEVTTVPFDFKSWSTYPNWLKWTIYIVAPMGLLFGIYKMMKKQSPFKRF